MSETSNAIAISAIFELMVEYRGISRADIAPRRKYFAQHCCALPRLSSAVAHDAHSSLNDVIDSRDQLARAREKQPYRKTAAQAGYTPGINYSAPSRLQQGERQVWIRVNENESRRTHAPT